MPVSDQAAVSRASELLEKQKAAREQHLDPVRRYWKGRQPLPAVIPSSAPSEVREMARIARVNIVDIVVGSLVQSLIVEGYRAEQPESDASDAEMVDATLPVWDTWQANRLDKRQAGIHAAAVAYGTGYSVVLPGTNGPVVRGVSPRKMTALYEPDAPDWPVEALERVTQQRLNYYDGEAIYRLVRNGDQFEHAETQPHSFGVPPVVRYQPEDDLDEDDEPTSEAPVGRRSANPTGIGVLGQVAPLVSLQDQIDLITFNLLVAQHYSAFRQRYAIGWVDANEQKAVETAASQMWAFKDHPDDMRLGEFEQTDLSGYIESREASLKHAATLSQTPVHELVGELVNMAAEALAAAEAGRDRKVDLFKTSLGESHEQQFQLIGLATGVDIPDDAQMVWRDTSARSFPAIVDALGKLAQMLGMPPQELWERVPGFTQQDIRRMKAVAEQGDAFAGLEDLLRRQTEDAPTG